MPGVVTGAAVRGFPPWPCWLWSAWCRRLLPVRCAIDGPETWAVSRHPRRLTGGVAVRFTGHMAAGKSTRARIRGAGHFAALTVSQLLEVVAQRSVDYLAEPGVGPVHDLRVALRRLRAVLSFLDPVLGEKAALARGEIREQAMDLGRLRDIDVFLEHLDAGIAPVADHDAGALREVLEGRREGLAEAVSAQLVTDGWQRPLTVVRRSTRKLADKGPAGQTAAGYCSRRLDRWWDRWVVASSEMPALAPRDLHQVRIRAKKLRYACEVSAELFEAPAVQTAGTIEGFKDIQDVLGAANDRATARRIVEDAGFDLAEGDVGQVDLGRAVALRAEIIGNGRFWR